MPLVSSALFTPAMSSPMPLMLARSHAGVRGIGERKIYGARMMPHGAKPAILRSAAHCLRCCLADADLVSTPRRQPTIAADATGLFRYGASMQMMYARVDESRPKPDSSGRRGLIPDIAAKPPTMMSSALRDQSDISVAKYGYRTGSFKR